MTTENTSSRDLRSAIIAATKVFLTGLESGASYERLNSILLEIKETELQLIKQEGTMLDPDMWKILHNRLARGSEKEIIDTTLEDN